MCQSTEELERSASSVGVEDRLNSPFPLSILAFLGWNAVTGQNPLALGAHLLLLATELLDYAKCTPAAPAHDRGKPIVPPLDPIVGAWVVACLELVNILELGAFRPGRQMGSQKTKPLLGHLAKRARTILVGRDCNEIVNTA